LSAQVGAEEEGDIYPLVDEGQVVYFIRLGTKPITTSTFEADIICGSFATSYLNSFVSLIRNVFLPALEAQENWGDVLFIYFFFFLLLFIFVS
jgi:hypothetical protein